MARVEDEVPVLVNLTSSQAAVLAKVAVVVTSCLDRKELNAAEQGLLVFRQAVVHALTNGAGRNGPKWTIRAKTG